MRLLNKKKKNRHGYLLVNNKNGDSSYVLYSAEFKNKKCVGVILVYYYRSNPFSSYYKICNRSDFNKIKSFIISDALDNKVSYNNIDLKTIRFIPTNEV